MPSILSQERTWEIYQEVRRVVDLATMESTESARRIDEQIENRVSKYMAREHVYHE